MNNKYLGYSRYQGLDKIRYIESTEKAVGNLVGWSPDIRSKEDDLLDLIFTRDPVTNLPTGAYQQFLSDKVQPEIRQFIMDYLMSNSVESGTDIPDDVRAQFNELPSEFIAQCSHNRYESVEQYEQRISEYIRQAREEDEFKARYERYKKSMKKSDD